MLQFLRKMPWAPVVLGAMFAISLCMARPVDAQALTGSVGPSVSPTGYFDCSLSGVWDDDGNSYFILIFVDGGIAYGASFSPVTGPVYVDFNANIGALENGNSLDPIYVPLSHGTHVCRFYYLVGGTYPPAPPLYDSGDVYETF